MNFIPLKMLTVTAPSISASFSDPPPGGQPHFEGGSVIGSDGRTFTNE